MIIRQSRVRKHCERYGYFNPPQGLVWTAAAQSRKDGTAMNFWWNANLVRAPTLTYLARLITDGGVALEAEQKNVHRKAQRLPAPGAGAGGV